jgi:hypothetical protein
MSISTLRRAVHTLPIAFVTLSAVSQGITTPRPPSPAGTVSQTIGISRITVNYSRPSVKNREIWGSLVPYGWNKQGFGTGNEAPWRAGANENTTISFSHGAVVEGKAVPAGVYGLFFVVNKDNTGELVLSKDNRSWGSFFYDPARDELRAPIRLKETPFTELLTYDFVNVGRVSADLVLNWEKKQIPVKIAFDVDKIVMANATEELKGVTGFSWLGFSTAANYALQNKVDLEQGLKWADVAVAQHRSFNTMNTRAGLLRELNRADEAAKLMNEALEIATEAELNAYGYQLLNSGEQDKAIEVLKLNTSRYPKSANTWDSLGEAFFNKGDKKNAIANFRKALEMNPPENVKLNSEKFLRQLGGL